MVGDCPFCDIPPDRLLHTDHPRVLADTPLHGANLFPPGELGPTVTEYLHAVRPVADDVFVACRAELESHMLKEERVLFPLILEGLGARASGPVRVMEMEHEEHGRNLARIRQLTSDLTAPDDACPTWHALYVRLAQLESELFDHMHLEITGTSLGTASRGPQRGGAAQPRQGRADPYGI